MITTTYTASNSISGTTTYTYALPAKTSPGDDYGAYLQKSATIKTTDAKGNLWIEVRNMRGKLLSRTAPDGAVATFTYDAAGYLISGTDENGHATTYTRDATRELVTSIKYPDLTTESFSYNSFGQVLTHTRRNGGVESFTYTTAGLLKTQKSAAGQLTTYNYDGNYRVASVTDGDNNTTSFQYNDRGEITKETNADGSFKTRSYDSFGNLLQETNELGYSGKYSYDSLNRMVTATDPLGRKTSFAFDAKSPGNGSPILVTSPSGRRSAAAYQSAFGYQMSSLTLGYGTPLATTFRQSFDILGNIIKVTPPAGNALNFVYDARNRRTETTDPAGNVTTFSYDNVGNLLTQTNANGSTVNTYDSKNRLIKSVYPSASPSASPDPVSVSFGYDPEDAIKSYHDPNNNGYVYSYDLDERQTRCTYPDGSSHQLSYDPAGNIKTFTTRDGRIKTHSYDNRNRCTSYNWNDGVTPGASKSYDAANRLTHISNINSAISYTYDAADDPITEVQNITGLGGKTVKYTYSAEAELQTMTYPDGTVIGYSWDALGNLANVLLGGTTGTPIVHYTYDSSGNRTGKNLANGVNSVLTYDAAQRLASITDTAPVSVGGTLLQKFNYGYDSMNRLKYVKRANGLGDVYSYDPRNQLMGVQYNAATPDSTPTNPSRSVSYVFDAAGNRTQTVDSVAGTTNYASNKNNQYTSVGASPLTYDTRGNLTSLLGANYAYDAENKLVQAPGASFAYDPYGRCVKRSDNSGTTYMVYGRGWHLIAEYNVSGIQQARYVQGTLPDEILTRTNSFGITVYYHTDHLGSVTKLTLSTGQVAEDYNYDVYGSATIRDVLGTTLTGSAYGNRFMFTGREYLSSPKLYDYRNRVYSAQLGRFLQPDLVGHDGDLFNLYRYAGNNPVNKIDPSGLNDYNFSSDALYDLLGNLVSYDESWTYTDDAGNTYSSNTSWRAAGGTLDPPSFQPESYSHRETESTTPQVANAPQPGQAPAADAGPAAAPASAPAAAPAPAPVAPVFDARSEGILTQLQPQVAALARQHLVALRAANIDARLIAGFRTYQEQDQLYAQGRSGGPAGPRVTNARGGESNHNFGVAYDIGISRDGWRTLLDDGPEYDRAGALGAALGLEWGGNWRRFQDRPHFQFTGGQTTRQLRQRFEAGLPVLP